MRDDFMETIQKIPRHISPQRQATRQAFLPLLQSKREKILSTPRTTHQYGPLTRHQVDVYASKMGVTSPIFIWLYGGGLVFGGRNDVYSDGLIYANVGHFFSEHGFTTMVPDYRLCRGALDSADPAPVSCDEDTAAWPSGAEDIYWLLKYVLQSASGLQGWSPEIYILGNSAGGMHLASFLYSREFFLSASDPLMRSVRQALKKAVLLGTPSSLIGEEAIPGPIRIAYYGSHDMSERCSVYSLFQQLTDDEVSSLPPTIALASPLDTDEILAPNRQFNALARRRHAPGFEIHQTASSSGKEHNHISTFACLASGEGEDWAEEMIDWFKV